MLQGCGYDDKCNSSSKCQLPVFSYEWDSSHPCLSLVTFKNIWCMHPIILDFTLCLVAPKEREGKGQGKRKQNIFPLIIVTLCPYFMTDQPLT